MIAAYILAAENNWWEVQFAMNKDNIVKAINEEYQKSVAFCGESPEPAGDRIEVTTVG